MQIKNVEVSITDMSRLMHLLQDSNVCSRLALVKPVCWDVCGSTSDFRETLPLLKEERLFPISSMKSK